MDVEFSKYTALVVDDEPPFRRFFKTLLEKGLKFKVFEASNPLHAFEIIKETKVDLIILDMEMPVMDGFTALKHIRENEEYNNVPVIICTALRSRDLFSSLTRLKIADFIIKPSNSQIIMGKIFNAMNRYYGTDVPEVHKPPKKPKPTPIDDNNENSDESAKPEEDVFVDLTNEKEIE